MSTMNEVETSGEAPPTTIELTRFRVRPEKEAQLLAARPGMLDAFRRDRSGFLDAQLVRLPQQEWLDIVSWRSAEDFAASRGKGANHPEIAAFFEAIEELLSSDQGTLLEFDPRSREGE